MDADAPRPPHSEHLMPIRANSTTANSPCLRINCFAGSGPRWPHVVHMASRIQPCGVSFRLISLGCRFRFLPIPEHNQNARDESTARLVRHARRMPGPTQSQAGQSRPEAETDLIALLGGRRHGTRPRHRPIRPQERADVAHRERNLVRRILPRVKAHLRVRREMHGFHGDGIRVRRHVVR